MRLLDILLCIYAAWFLLGMACGLFVLRFAHRKNVGHYYHFYYVWEPVPLYGPLILFMLFGVRAKAKRIFGK